MFSIPKSPKNALRVTHALRGARTRSGRANALFLPSVGVGGVNFRVGLAFGERCHLWWQLVNTKRGELVRDVYEWSRSKTVNNWCRYTKKLLIELGMREEWDSEDLGKRSEWMRRVRAAVRKRETEKWREEMEVKTKLDRYREIKTELKYEEYLECGGTRAEVANFVQCRGGVARLRVETGRWIGLRREERVCECCASGEVEDETHMMTRCRKWKEVWKNMREEWEKRGLEGEEAVRWTLAGMTLRGRGTSQMRKVLQEVGTGMSLREGEDRRIRKEGEAKRKEEERKAKETKKTRIVWRMRVK